ncbi:DUF6306 domain-containing protein [Tepidibacillus infernus]|uniref:DUF6306 domain-containing protein n=1 Tax=Tepidibacillus decaturensis TaxID=1413211 RepID=A0A135L4F1_9BACI|nr:MULTISPECIES: DUF6306 domain-containing protein [Tepidibacillus]KXG43866.1 hypothetical protein U473_07495 [Tepidibacillus decaturensis]GBF11162.1 hypothetical protein HK1_01185 [Tepidibacillus sp. HK-1]
MENKKIELLNQLLEAEKAGVVTLDFFQKAYPDVELPLDLIKSDESWSTNGLIESVKREGGVPSKNTGDFADKVKAQEGLSNRLSLLNKGQSWVVRKIDDLFQMELHEETRSFLTQMKKKHIENIQTCQDFLDRQ